MRRLLLCALVALLTLPAFGQVVDETGASGVYTPNRTASATLGALNAAATVNLSGRQGVGGYLALGTLSGTVTPEVTVDGSTWVATSFLTWSAGAAPARAATINATTLFQIEVPAGARSARIRVSSYSSGSGTATLIATEAPGVPGAGATQPVSGTVGVSGSVTVTDGSGPLTVDGTVAATQSGTWSVRSQDGSGNALASSTSSPAGTEQALIVRNVPSGTQAVSAASLPLPSGAAQEHATAGSPHAARLTDGSAFYKATTPADTQPISAASLPLPTGAATAANQDGIIRDGTGDTTQANVTSGRLNVDGSGVTQPVSGTVTANAGSGTFTVSGTVTANAGTGTLGTNVAQVGGTSTATNAGDASAGTIRTVQAGAPTLAYGQVSCGTTATSIAAARAGRRAINVTLLASGTDVFFGDASVTTAAGDKLLGIDGAARSYPTSAALYCRVASGSVSVSYMEIF